MDNIPEEKGRRLQERASELHRRGTRRPWLGWLGFRAYRWRALRPLIRLVLARLEGGLMFSRTWRRIWQHYYGTTLGEYSYGPGLRPGLFPPGTSIGTFCSFAAGIQVLRRNHPTDWLSQHPLFFNRVVGLLENDAIHSLADNPLTIGSDVWIGLNAIICPGCRVIGDGAIIAAGAVVTKDVPPFTIVGGSPARVIRRRFTPEIEQAVADSRWWTRPLPTLVEELELFHGKLTPASLARLAAAFGV